MYNNGDLKTNNSNSSNKNSIIDEQYESESLSNEKS